ncbi:hypothetical protein SK128_006669 [Halocaridina rubra]|uniref:F-box domain-containing protein n=1 Tax=Halocaridina rubra TaxID=373956 RepID=A0AAN8WMD0_HALRR
MTSVVVYKRQSYVDIIPEDDYYTQSAVKPPEEALFSFFDLPWPICVNVVSHLSLRDTRAVALTCRAGWYMSRDQLMWRNKLWLRAKVINLALVGPSYQPPLHADMLICDPLLVNNKLLYEILDPDSGINENHEDLDIGNLLSKMATPTSSLGLSDLFESFFSIFSSGAQQNSPSDPFSKGEGAPTFLLFGTPETRVSKKLALSFIASKDSTFDTVGLVKGKPGGVGGGVTVKYAHHLMNLLTVRRARPRLLVNSPQGTTFHPDVAEVVARVDGLICYMDATCMCSIDNSLEGRRKSSGVCEANYHTLDLLELEAMMRTVPSDLAPPILILLAHMDNPVTNLHDSESEDDSPTHVRTQDQERHRPAMLHKMLGKLDLPWAICEVEVKSLVGVHRGLNWLLKRTLKLKNG